MNTDFTTWSRENLENFARDAMLANALLQENIKVLLDVWRDVVTKGIGTYTVTEVDGRIKLEVTYMTADGSMDKAKAWDRLATEVSESSPVDMTTMEGLGIWMGRTLREARQ